VIPHALSQVHLDHARNVANRPAVARLDRSPCVGYVGNLEHSGVDWPTILRLIEQFPECSFRLIGPYNTEGGGNQLPLSTLARLTNVKLTGAKSADEILKDAAEVDIWLVCYDSHRTVDGATNSHKILEYLATGSPVLSNRIEAYIGSPLIVMSDEMSNADMPQKLGHLLQHSCCLNSEKLRRQRAEFALKFSYVENLRNIDSMIVGINKKYANYSGFHAQH
jgi:hypothetical protein